jgi:rubrerythrin
MNKNKFWKCTYCGYILTDTEYLLVKWDFGCPRCHTHLGNFKSFEIKK